MMKTTHAVLALLGCLAVGTSVQASVNMSPLAGNGHPRGNFETTSNGVRNVACNNSQSSWYITFQTNGSSCTYDGQATLTASNVGNSCAALLTYNMDGTYHGTGSSGCVSTTGRKVVDLGREYKPANGTLVMATYLRGRGTSCANTYGIVYGARIWGT